MTKQQIHKKVNSEGNISKANVINFMWEHFESRKCENCKYGDTKTEGTIICRHIDDAMPFHVPLDFGCNKWEAKGEEDENN